MEVIVSASKQLNDFQNAIHQKALQISKAFRKVEGELITVLQKVEEGRVYLALGYPSLFEYSTKALLLSEGNGYVFVQIARKSRQIPELKEAIDRGDLSVSKAKRILPVLTAENKSEWIERAVKMPRAALEKEVAKVHPEVIQREIVRRTDEENFSVKLSLSEKVLGKLKRAQTLEASRQKRNVSLIETLEAVLENYLAQKDPLERSKPKEMRAGKSEIKVSRILLQNRGNSKRRTSLRLSLKREVLQRDRGMCQYRKDQIETCGESRFVQIHHIQPLSRGGKDEITNLVTLCTRHHDFLHEFEKNRPDLV